MFVNIQLWPVNLPHLHIASKKLADVGCAVTQANSLFALLGFKLELVPILCFLRYYLLRGGQESYWGWYQHWLFVIYTVMVTFDGILVLLFVIIGMRAADAPRVQLESDSRFSGITSIMCMVCVFPDYPSTQAFGFSAGSNEVLTHELRIV